MQSEKYDLFSKVVRKIVSTCDDNELLYKYMENIHTFVELIDLIITEYNFNFDVLAPTIFMSRTSAENMIEQNHMALRLSLNRPTELILSHHEYVAGSYVFQHYADSPNNIFKKIMILERTGSKFIYN